MMDIRNIKRKIMQAVTAVAMTAAVTAGICMTGAVTAQAAEQTAQTAEQKTGADSSVQASKVNINIVPANKESTAKIKDGSYSTSITFTADNTLTITPADANDRIYGLYITWAVRPGEWTLTYDGGIKKCGRNAFLHEYVEIPEGTTSAIIELSQKEKICNIDAYSAGTLPDDVQVWEPECARADMLVLSTHADDEILFLGGVLAQYAGEDKLDVQVVYFSNYFGGTVIREHEKLDGLWELGVRHYPVNGDFPDQYADDLAAAEKLYGHDEAAAFVVEQIRRFKPQVCVAQDTMVSTDTAHISLPLLRCRRRLLSAWIRINILNLRQNTECGMLPRHIYICMERIRLSLTADSRLTTLEEGRRLRLQRRHIKSMCHSSGAGSMYLIPMSTVFRILDFTGLLWEKIPAMI